LVLASLRILLDEAYVLERAEETVNGALRQTQLA